MNQFLAEKRSISCVICLEATVNGGMMMLCCGSIVHFCCLNSWLVKSKSRNRRECPVCHDDFIQPEIKMPLVTNPSLSRVHSATPSSDNYSINSGIEPTNSISPSLQIVSPQTVPILGSFLSRRTVPILRTPIQSLANPAIEFQDHNNIVVAPVSDSHGLYEHFAPRYLIYNVMQAEESFWMMIVSASLAVLRLIPPLLLTLLLYGLTLALYNSLKL